jgi:hypothetical protein
MFDTAWNAIRSRLPKKDKALQSQLSRKQLKEY